MIPPCSTPDGKTTSLSLFRETAGPSTAMAVAGGVAANGAIRRALMRFCGEAGLRLVVPPESLKAARNAAIAAATRLCGRRSFTHRAASVERSATPPSPSPPGRARHVLLYAHAANWPGFAPPRWPVFALPMTG